MIKIIKEKLGNKPSTFMFLQIFAYEIHLAKIRIKNKIFPSKKLKINKYKNQENLRLHWGCGSRKLDKWVNVDGWKTSATDFEYDLRESIPLSNSSVSYIFTEHVLEHITIEEGRMVLKEFHRILNKDGIARIVVPDLELCCNAFLSKDVNWFEKVDDKFETAGMGFNSIFYNHSHRYIYDFESLNQLLLDAGFKTIKKQKYNESFDKELLVDNSDESRKLVSLYVEAIK